MLDGTNDF
jgi:hypothetical protein